MLTATDHASPPEFEREWPQSPFGHQVIAEGSGHYIQNDQPNLVVERIRDLLQQLHSQAR